jgi:acetyl-CoA carboxylase biotin carboxylase subunit
VKRVLVANRSEIAVRVIRACRELELETVAIYSQADRDARHVQMADQAVCIGPPRPSESYLRADLMIQVAKATGCDAIHPGYGFLSENAEFSRECVGNGLTFVGPSADVIKSMGDKVHARKLAAGIGVPTVEGTVGDEVAFEDVQQLASRAGFPILLKAAAGGGGRGMRVVRSQEELRRQYEEAGAEAKAAFGDGSVYAERFLARIRHVEVQIVGDHQGNVVHFGTRDCSLQRRHQKVMEEAPAACVSDAAREAMADDAVRLASYLRYVGAGTVEFVVDVESGKHFFIEANTRIQVEHPVTELVTGVDLVREQLQVADPSNALSVRQSDIVFRGHAIEFRINAEDPERGFTPCPGTISALQVPGGPGVRFDSHCYQGYTIGPYYDSLMAKLIVHDSNRDRALSRARRALGELEVGGVTTNASFLRRLLDHPDIASNEITTGWLEQLMAKAPAHN